jgi:glucose/arabinose dehydrogenase
LTVREVATFDEPVVVLARPRDPDPDRVHVAERSGRVVAVELATGRRTDVADLTARTRAGGERGLLGMAFSPDGSRLYVHYTDRNGDTNVDEFTMTAAGRADPLSRRRLLLVEQPFANHNGGDLVTGPDGMLYLGLGDGGSAGDPEGNGQDLGSLLGKLLRIDPRPVAGASYGVPSDNPFVGRPGTRPEIWSYGLRNPWRFSFDPATGDLWIGDVGQDRLEEIDVARAADGGGRGVNFGWKAFEGSRVFDRSVPAPGAAGPYHEYPHGTGDGEGCSVTGGVVYRGTALAGLAGAYLFADYCVPGIRAVPASGAGAAVSVPLTDGPTEVVAFGVDGSGEPLVASLGGGLYRIEAAR